MTIKVDPYPAKQEAATAEPYPPSFVDKLTSFIQRLPIPYGLTYFLLFILQAGLIHVFGWLDGWLPAPTFSPILLVFPLWLWVPLAIITYLDTLSLEVLSSFSRLLDISPEKKERLAYEFTTMPSRGVIISALFWSGVHVLFWYLAYDTVIPAYGYNTLTLVIVILEGIATFFVGSAIYYHSIRQLYLVNRTVRMVDHFDLFQLEPVYAFSVLTAQTGVGWVILLTLTLLVVPVRVAPIPTLVMLVVQVALALVTFLLPLRIVNQRLVSEKRQHRAVLDQRFKATLARLHQCIDGDILAEVEQINDALAGLNIEGEILAKIPTWPWRPGLFAGFLSIVVLPIILFLVQFALGTWLGN